MTLRCRTHHLPLDRHDLGTCTHRCAVPGCPAYVTDEALARFNAAAREAWDTVHASSVPYLLDETKTLVTVELQVAGDQYGAAYVVDQAADPYAFGRAMDRMVRFIDRSVTRTLSPL